MTKGELITAIFTKLPVKEGTKILSVGDGKDTFSFKYEDKVYKCDSRGFVEEVDGIFLKSTIEARSLSDLIRQ